MCPFGFLNEAEFGCASDHGLEGCAGNHGSVRFRIEKVLIAAVAQDEAVIGIVKRKSLVDAFNGVDQTLPGIGDFAQVLFLDLDRRVAEHGECLRHLSDLVAAIRRERRPQVAPGNRQHAVAKIAQPCDEVPVDIEPDDEQRTEET